MLISANYLLYPNGPGGYPGFYGSLPPGLFHPPPSVPSEDVPPAKTPPTASTIPLAVPQSPSSPTLFLPLLCRPEPILPAASTFSDQHSDGPSEGSSVKLPNGQSTAFQQKTSAGMTTSKQLKFGVDRILSDDISVSKKDNHQIGGIIPSTAYHSVSNSPMVTCSECVSTLTRCCRPTFPLYPLSMAPTTLHFPSAYQSMCPSLSGESSTSTINGHSSNHNSSTSTNGGKRKRSWSRAVFSNLQRKGLEKRFQIQKYITKPDRRQLAATLGLTDAQVKVWFQNRRMKWRHTKESKPEAVVPVPACVNEDPADSTREDSV